MGHIGTSTLQLTQKCTNGIPPIPSSAPLFKCPFCEKAKTMKRSGKPKSEDRIIPVQQYHMDLSFVSGPSNLTDILKFNAAPQKSINKSRDGYIGFLTIIDVATRHLWTHLVKSKEPPIEFIDAFLKKHGIKKTDPLKAVKITTTTDGLLASSRAFETAMMDKELDIEAIPQSEVARLLEGNPIEAFIMTDGGDELTDDKIWKLVDSHGYIAIMSAPDGSHQNGIVERPHRTLKKRIRCMLYSARLGTKFKADSLMHATWLYN